MGTFTVREILSQREWPVGEDPPKVIYYDFLVEGDDRKVNVGRKPTNPLTVGTVLEGTIEKDERGNGLKFVKANANGFGGGGAGRPRDPRERKSIQMQHAQKCAVEALRLAAEFGQGAEKYTPPSAADVVAQVKLIANGLFQQIEEAAA